MKQPSTKRFNYTPGNIEGASNCLLIVPEGSDEPIGAVFGQNRSEVEHNARLFCMAQQTRDAMEALLAAYTADMLVNTSEEGIAARNHVRHILHIIDVG